MDYIVGLIFATGNAIVENAPYLAGVLLPPLVTILNRDVPDSRARFLVATMTCLITGAILDWKQIAYGTPEKAVESIGIIFLESQAVYRLYFKGSYVEQQIQERIGKLQPSTETELERG